MADDPLDSRRQILILCPYPRDTAPSQRLKYEQFIPYLEAQGYCIRVLPFFSSRTYEILYKRGRTLRKAAGVLAGIARRLALLLRIARADPTARFELISRDAPAAILAALHPAPAWADRLQI